MSLELIVGLGVLSFLFLYFAFKLDDDHFILKLFLLFFFCTTILVMPQSVINNDCTIKVNETTVSGSITSYDYESFCDDTTTKAELNFLRIPNWFFRIFITYFFIFLFYHWAKKSEYFGKLVGRRK